MPLASITDQMLLVPQTMLQEPSGTSCTIRMFLQLAPRQSGSGWNQDSRDKGPISLIEVDILKLASWRLTDRVLNSAGYTPATFSASTWARIEGNQETTTGASFRLSDALYWLPYWRKALVATSNRPCPTSAADACGRRCGRHLRQRPQ
jgi:hypothetical protein